MSNINLLRKKIFLDKNENKVDKLYNYFSLLLRLCDINY